MTNEEAKELYYLATFTLKNFHYEINEDLVQDLVLYTLTMLDRYDEKRGSKSTFIVLLMKSRLKMLRRNNKLMKNNGGVPDLSLDCSNNENEEIDMYRVLSADYDLEDEVGKYEILKLIIPLVEEPLMLKLNGWTLRQIAAKYGCTTSNIHRKIKLNVRNIKTFCRKNKLHYDM